MNNLDKSARDHKRPSNQSESTLSADTLSHLYRLLLTPRLVEERMLLLLRQGKLSKWFSGIGQEAISVGITAALEPSDRIFTLHRNLGVFTSRGVPLWRLFRQFQGDEGGFTKGRDRSFHFGSQEHSIIGMISHLGPQLAVATGAALAEKLRGGTGIAAERASRGYLPAKVERVRGIFMKRSILHRSGICPLSL